MSTQSVKQAGLTIAYIGGGSRGWAWGFMKDLAMDPHMGGVVRLYDIDREAALKNQRIGTMISAHPEALADWRYEAVDTLEAALKGADIVVISILPGNFDHMASDVHLPEEHGIYQSVGDTTGPGGLLRALRTVPMNADIARAIQATAPKAWVINYTNPMAACIGTLYEVFPGIRAFGCCHEVFGTQKLLAAMLEEVEGIRDIPRQDIKTQVNGVNHFTWLTSASYKGQDLFPAYEAFAKKYQDTGYLKGQDSNWMNSFFHSSHKVKFDLFLRYGAIAAAGDRHLAEFMPPWYLKDPKTAQSWGFTLTPVSWRKTDLQERIRKREALLDGSEPLALTASGEEGHLLIKALLGLGDLASNVNLPNRGQSRQLPLGAVVETNALFRDQEISPVMAEDLPAPVVNMVARHADNQLSIVKAALECDWQLAFNVLQNDPQAAHLPPSKAAEMFERMVNNTLDVLPAKWRRGSHQQ